MNYIPTDKLIAEIEKALKASELHRGKAVADGSRQTLYWIKDLITSLQQKQPDLPGIEESGIPGKDYIPVEWVDACEKYGKWKIVKQEQPEVLGYDRALLEVKSKVDELYEESSIGLNEYDMGLYNGIAETCMKLRGFIKARISSEEQPEAELSEFEKGLVKFYRTRGEIQPDKDGVFNRHEVDELLHKAASELLSLAREQFIKDGYVIEKKIFHDAVKKVNPEVMKEVSENVDMQIALRTEYEKGRADALKDLPRWRKCGEYTLRTYGEEHFEYRGDGRYLVMKGMEILLSDLEKLPKED